MTRKGWSVTSRRTAPTDPVSAAAQGGAATARTRSRSTATARPNRRRSDGPSSRSVNDPVAPDALLERGPDLARGLPGRQPLSEETPHVQTVVGVVVVEHPDPPREQQVARRFQ